jgi:hypothetical protein
VAIGDSDLSGIEKGPPHTGIAAGASNIEDEELRPAPPLILSSARALVDFIFAP